MLPWTHEIVLVSDGIVSYFCNLLFPNCLIWKHTFQLFPLSCCFFFHLFFILIITPSLCFRYDLKHPKGNGNWSVWNDRIVNIYQSGGNGTKSCDASAWEVSVTKSSGLCSMFDFGSVPNSWSLYDKFDSKAYFFSFSSDLTTLGLNLNSPE